MKPQEVKPKAQTDWLFQRGDVRRGGYTQLNFHPVIYDRTVCSLFMV